MNTLTKVFVGVDISKNWIDVHLNPINKEIRIDNSIAGMSKLKKLLIAYQVQQIVCEATGGYEQLLIKKLRSKYKVWCADPRVIKAFIRSEGKRVKTDKSDARMIALFASQKKCSYMQLHRSDVEEKLHALSRRREDLVKMLSAEKTRHQHPEYALCKDQIEELITYINSQIGQIDTEIAQIIDNDSNMKHKTELMKTVPGVGQITATTLVVNLPELGILNKKQISAMSGVAPYTQESGLYKGKAKISGGRNAVKKILFISALVAIRHNKKMKELYERLIAAGKRPKVAIVAVMHKLIIVINAMIRTSTAWSY
jgi:transposase